MIVLRIDVHGHSADVRWAGAEAVVGSGGAAAIQRDDAGWAAREAVLVHRGDEVLLVPAAGGDPVRLRPGDTVRLREATLTLVGLLPLAATGDDEPAPVAPARADLGPAPVALELAPEPAPAPAPRPAPTPSAGGAPAAPTPSLRRTSFEDELLAMMRRSPWWALSVAIHAVLIVALMVLVPERPLTPHVASVHGVVVAAEENDDPLLSGGPVEPEPTVEEPEERTAPEPAPVPEPSSEPLPDLESREQDPPVPVEPLPEEDAAPPVVMVGPSGAAPSLRVQPKNALTKPPSKEDLEGKTFDEQRALEVNRAAAARVREAIARGGGPLGRALKGLKTADVLVVDGTFDHMETVLEELAVPFTFKSPAEVATDGSLSRHKVVFWNCGENTLAPHLHTRAVDAVRTFVREGGYLFTTDWALAHVVLPAFPGYLATEGRIRPLPELIVHVVAPAAAQGHALLDGVLEEDAPPRWWLESASFDVKVLKKGAVEVLLEAPALDRPPHARSPVVAATFTYGRGRVLHVMGHYYQQKGNLAGAVGAQRLPLNFVRMRLEADAPPR